MIYRWKLRREFFNGPGTYPLELNSETGEPLTINLTVDDRGCFELESTPGFSVQAFAEPVV